MGNAVRVRRFAAWPLLGVLTAVLWIEPVRAGKPPPSAGIDFYEPHMLTGTIHAMNSPRREVLFTFRRTATRQGDVVQVLREYRLPDKTLAAQERVVYEGNRLVSYELEDARTGEKGRALVQTNASGNRELRLEFGRANARKAAAPAREVLQANTLINDMLPAFLAAHWPELMQGAKVKFRFVALARSETVGFELARDSESTLDGTKVVRLRMEPTSIILARFVDPLFFIVEKEGDHRILQYTGRTTPRVKSGDTWKDLDALTVFDWK